MDDTGPPVRDLAQDYKLKFSDVIRDLLGSGLKKVQKITKTPRRPETRKK